MLPVGVTDGAPPVRHRRGPPGGGRDPAHAAPAADAVAAAAAHVPRVPELSQGSLAAGARPLAVLPGQALGAAAPDLLQLLLHSPAWAAAGGGGWFCFNFVLMPTAHRYGCPFWHLWAPQPSLKRGTPPPFFALHWEVLDL